MLLFLTAFKNYFISNLEVINIVWNILETKMSRKLFKDFLIKIKLSVKFTPSSQRDIKL